MNNIIQKVEDPELFFGIVAPIGASIEDAIQSLHEKLEAVGYRAKVLKLTDVFEKLQNYLKFPIELSTLPLEKRFDSFMSFGDALRKHFSDDSIMGSIAISLISSLRISILGDDDTKNPEKIAYIIRQFKRKEEIELLRSVYGRLFFQVSVYSRRSRRVDNLAKSIASSHNSIEANRYRTLAEHLVQRDENEISDVHGQRVGEIFHEADFIINADIGTPSISSQVHRFIQLIFGANVISPTKMEYGLYTAKSSSLRSLDLSRQVGAAIFSPAGEIISIGANEVPKGGGGTYWSDDDYDDRDFQRKIDSNQKRKNEILSEIKEIISNDNKGMDIFFNGLENSQFMDALEYGRIIHAEMSAISDAARMGRPTKGAILYCTTFPCHMCAKHIVAAGVSKVVFLEPYPKSLASDLHGDSIRIDGQSRGDYEDFPSVTFDHFHGVSPRRYRDLFERQRRKDKQGKLQEWQNGKRRCVVDIKIPAYLKLEAHILQSVLLPTLSKSEIPLEVISSYLTLES